MNFNIKRGMDLAIGGAPEQIVEPGPSVRRVALLGADYIGLEPKLLVEHGQQVGLGQPVFCDKRDPEVVFTSPAGGVIGAINRGSRRSLASVVIDVADSAAGEQRFEAFAAGDIPRLDYDTVAAQLLLSGLWTAFRTRPYSRVPRARSTPDAVFVTAIDTRPLAADPAVVLRADPEAFDTGLAVVARLTDGPVHVCVRAGTPIAMTETGQILRSEFDGPHPAGLPGTHIHLLHPVGGGRSVWHIGYQDVMAIGRLFTTGGLDVRRVVALGGPAVERPRLIETRLGASIDDLVPEHRLARVISGSVLCGRDASGDMAFLGRYHNQVSVLPEDSTRRLFGWFRRQRAVTTSMHGATAAMVATERMESLLPLDILASSLLRALLVGDAANAERLGCLELDEEDLALCSYACPSKIDYGPALRAALQQIWRQG